MRLLAVLVFAAACGGSSAPKAPTPPPPTPDPIPQTAGPDCKVVAEKLVLVALADNVDAQAKTREELHLRCKKDRWSDDARNCLATVENDAEIDGCRIHLTEPQRDALAAFAPPAAPAAAATADRDSPPPPAKEKEKTLRRTRGAVPKDSSDPCEGGEATGTGKK